MKQKNQPSHLINEKIRFSQIRVISDDHSNLGTMTPQEALRVAQEKQLDLVLVSDKAVPPVCRIVDYGKFKYEQEKQERAKPARTQLKELKMRYTIEEHDYQVRVNQARRFIKAGDQVKVTITFRGRETQHSDLGESLLLRMSEDLQESAQVQQAPKREGNRMMMILVPKTATPTKTRKEVAEPVKAKV